MSDLFLLASRKKYRFPSSKGQLTTEQLWDLPLQSAAGASLDAVAIALDSDLNKSSVRSFVSATNPAATELSTKLEIVKAIILKKQEENAAAVSREEKKRKRARILEALDMRENQELQSASREDLLKQLAAVDDE